MAEKAYLAIDMGASSGRHVVGLFDGAKLRLEETYRFENGPVDVAGCLYWDLLAQWSHVIAGLRAAGARFGNRIASVGVDMDLSLGNAGADEVVLCLDYGLVVVGSALQKEGAAETG